VVDVKWGVDRRVHDERRSATDISNVSSYTATGLSQSTLYYFVITPESVGYGSGTFSGDAVGSTATTTYDPSVAAIDASGYFVGAGGVDGNLRNCGCPV
jgi:hypothetical protein